MPELPLELCEAIVDHVGSRSDLLSLLCVSINFHSAVERRLYHTISLGGKPPPPNIAKKYWTVFERISTCPRVAAYVTHLAVDALSWPLPSSYSPTWFAPVYRSVPNLKSLRIYPSYDIILHFRPPVPFLLHTFHYSGSHPPFAQILETFLEAQIELKELIFRSKDKLTLTPSALPQLTTIHGTGTFISSIVPGRPITRVATHTVYVAEAPLPFHGPHIRSLCLTTPADLPYYTTLFPNLTFLQVAVRDGNYTDIQIYLRNLLVLEKLRITWSGHRMWSDEEVLRLIQPIFDDCPLLLCIETYDYSHDGKSKIWTRGSETCTLSPWDWDEWQKV